jgi:hypothetical protein
MHNSRRTPAQEEPRQSHLLRIIGNMRSKAVDCATKISIGTSYNIRGLHKWPQWEKNRSNRSVSGCDWLGPICRGLAQSGSLVFTSRLVGKGYTTINLVPTPQVKRVSSSQRSPVEFAKDCCSALQMRRLGCFSKDLSILSLVTGTPKWDN